MKISKHETFLMKAICLTIFIKYDKVMIGLPTKIVIKKHFWKVLADEIISKASRFCSYNVADKKYEWYDAFQQSQKFI